MYIVVHPGKVGDRLWRIITFSNARLGPQKVTTEVTGIDAGSPGELARLLYDFI